MNALSDIMTNVSQEMTLQLEKVRTSIEHGLSKGMSIEEEVRKFLRNHLPDSIGITQGTVIDSHGQRSRQVDIILYDVARTPLFFQSPEGGHQLVPAEGVLAVIEVKTSVGKADVKSLITHMQSVKTLDKSAYHKIAIQTTYAAYGESVRIFPTMYFVFAFECSNHDGFHAELVRQSVQLPLRQRIDNVCFLDNYIILNYEGEPPNTVRRINALPDPNTRTATYPTNRSLLMWYLMIVDYLTQIEIPPIHIRQYIPDGFIL